MRFNKILLSFLPLLLVIIIALFFRFVHLDKVPNAIGGDEIVYVLNSKALHLTGHDIFGSWSPIQGFLFQYPKGEAQAELPYVLYSFIVGPLPFTLLSAKLVNLILGVLIVAFIYLVTKEILGKNVALCAAFVASINPWLVYIGRTAYEAVPATLFYLVALFILLKAKSWQILLAFPFLVLAFYSYIGTKVILLPFALVAILYSYYFISKKKYLKQYTLLFSLCLLLVFLFLVSLKLNPAMSRLDEILTPNNSEIAQQVNELRKVTIETPVTNLLLNKYTVFANITMTKTLKTFASDYLFVSGDEFFSLYRHGLFYYIDSIFVVLGALFLFSKKKNIFTFLGVLSLVGIIPMIIHSAKTDLFSIHAAMTYPLIIIVGGFGIWETINYFKNKNLGLVLGSLILVLYAISSINFLSIYLYWFPLQGHFDFPVRVASSYAKRASDNQKVTVYSTSAFDYYKKFLFYSNGYNKDTAKTVSENLNKGNYTLGNVIFVSCNVLEGLEDKKNAAIIDDRCGQEAVGAHLSISRLKDGGESMQIYNDNICKNVGLNRYPQNIKLSDFNIEDLSNEDFCKTFITSF